jgi:subtilisin family serine protease
MKKLLFITLFILLVSGLYSQNQSDTQNVSDNDMYLNWHLKSPSSDLIYGAEVNKAYETLLLNKQSKTIIVAVIDGGVDIYHEDLKDNIWINTDEIPENGIDDDNNGYIDDIHGWNFIGNSKGEHIVNENLEVTRIYKQYKDKYDGIKPKNVPANEKETYNLFIEAKEIYSKLLNEAEKTRDQINTFESNFYLSDKQIKSYLNKDSYDISDLDKINSEDKEIMRSARFLKYLLENNFTIDQISEIRKYNDEELNYHFNVDFNPREIVGDNIEVLSPVYGNNDVYGPDAEHGTFVAGIIGAIRNNNLGIDGIASDVKIMSLRAVPNGDERDKDVANAIRYAADNGAQIINMSFGKDLSPQKKLVDEAAMYAQQKGVLLIHAAGNDGANIDKENNFPSKQINNNLSVENWITVGATTMTADLNFVADFSNYGKNSVDLFAPGVNIKSLVPESNYDVLSGTSFSAPVVSGIAALIWSYYPELTATDIKNIILSSTNTYSDLIVNRPNQSSGKSKKTKFGKLSKTSGVVSLFNALQIADNFKIKQN